MIIVMFHAWLSYPWGYCRSGVGEALFVGDKRYDHDIIKHATWPDKGIIPIPAVCGNILYDRACPACEEALKITGNPPDHSYPNIQT